jgi:ComF family protein
LSAAVYNPILKKLLGAYKYPPYMKDLEKVLVDLMGEALIQQELFIKLLEKDIALVPIPLSLKKYRARGYNQAEELAKLLGNRISPLAKASGNNKVSVVNILQRVKETKTQVNLTKEEREENVKSAFSLVPTSKEKISGKTIVLVDDVLTTGATMNECAGILYRIGVKEVWGVTLAHGK